MKLSAFLSNLIIHFLLAPALIGTTYLYLYPLFQGCGFPEPRSQTPEPATCQAPSSPQSLLTALQAPFQSREGSKAPFRLLALADPQLEGDTSLPPHEDETPFPSLVRLRHEIAEHGFSRVPHAVRVETSRFWTEDISNAIRTYRKKLDLWGNDLYLAHVYRSVRWWADPTHVAVLGDLLGSQWIGDEEFTSRSGRFWGRVFKGGQKIEFGDISGGGSEVMGEAKWKRKIMALAGNHDIGYAGDVDDARIGRFEEAFGSVNYEATFRLNETAGEDVPELRILVLNSMILDEPAKDTRLLDDTREYLNRKLYFELPAPETSTVLLTHIPLYKEAGICVDGPFFDYFDEAYGGGIKEQNHLSQAMSERILDGVIGPERDRAAVILNGHDHSGCHVYHSTQRMLDIEALMAREAGESPGDTWDATRFESAAAQATIANKSLTGVEEVTVRSMMGSYGGNAGLLSAWWDAEAKRWRFEYAHCMCGVQHIWWAVHVLDLVLVALGILWVGVSAVELVRDDGPRVSREKKTS